MVETKKPEAKPGKGKQSFSAMPQGRSVEHTIFSSIDVEGKNRITKEQFIKGLAVAGILEDDNRLLEVFANIKHSHYSNGFDFNEFKQVVGLHSQLIYKALQGKVVIPAFESFCQDIRDIYKTTKENRSGNVADYIPQLKRVDPELYGISLCTIDGQRFSIGDSQVPFCAQSACKPVNYCIALNEIGDKVHDYVGHEPSGKSFNELTLNERGLPHNPMINAGAIMCCSLIKPQLDIADRFDYVLETWKKIAGNRRVGFNNAVYLSERQTADRNFALGYFMKEKKAFPKNINLIEVLEFYFQCCSIELTTDIMAIVASTLASGGVCPLTGEKIFDSNIVKNCLSLMSSCGMYNFSGEFAFRIGLPAKSGVSGVIMIVVPNVLGMCVWSPRLDGHGNSVRGIDFCRRLIELYNFHNYDSLVAGQCTKKNPRLPQEDSKVQQVVSLCWAAYRGDLQHIQHLVARGINLDIGDYDGRTALHLAVSEGHLPLVEYLLNKGIEVSPVDRAGRTPLDDAIKRGDKESIELLQKHGAGRNQS